MKSSSNTKRFVVAGLVSLGIAAAGALPAFAGGEPGTASGECRNGSSPNGTERAILQSPAYLAVEYAVNDTDGSQFATVCYSDTPVGAPSELAGGFVHAREHGSGFDAVWCQSDPGTTVAANCFVASSLTVGDPNPAATGGTVSGYVTANGTTVSPNQTGAEVGSLATPLDAPLDGNGRTGGGAAMGNGTCVYANGTTPFCPGGSPGAGETYNESDGPQYTTGGGAGLAVWVGNSNSDTVTGTADANTPYQCVNVGAPAPSCPTSRTP